MARPEKGLDAIDHRIREIFLEKFEKVGYRQIKMLLERNDSLIVNHKKIRRSMKLQELVCKIRRKKPRYGNQYHSNVERAFPNLLEQDFNVVRPDAVYSGDITEVRLSSSRKVYMHMVKDLATKEIVSYNVSTSPNAELVLSSFRKHLKTLSKKQLKQLIYHTDQGGVFMSDPHIALTGKLKVKQSMSRRGNCLDNAPIESFFGHMKDYVDFKKMETLKDVEIGVEKYIHYYNNERPQWGLKKMTPVEYRSHLN